MIRDTSAQDHVIRAEPKRRRLVVWALVGIAAVIALALLVPTAARLFSSDASASLSRLRIAEVKRGTLVRDVSVQGQVVAAVSPTLYAPYGGTVTMRVNAGDKVAKDQVLAEIDSPELTNKLQQENATLQSLTIEVERTTLDHRKAALAAKKLLDQAKIDRQTAARDVERNERAFKAGALAELDVLRAKDALAKADLTVANAEADLRLDVDTANFDVRTKRLALERQKYLVADLERQVDGLKIRSPVDGQVGTLIVQTSANVPANAAILSVVDLTALEMEVKVPEASAQGLGVGMAAEIQDGGARYPGEVSAISPSIVDGQLTGRVRFTGEKPAGLRQNQRLTTRLLMESKENVLMVERGAWVDAGGGRIAYVVRGNVAERTPVQVGATSLSAVELVSGAREGDRIVISDTESFKGAQRVALN